MGALRAAIPDIAAEYKAAVKAGTLQNDYSLKDGEATLHKAGSTTEPGDAAAVSPDAGRWEWLSYVQQGRRNAAFAAECPRTVEALESIPDFMPSAGAMPFSYAFFSVMHPGTAIDSHFGPTNARLRVHVPIIVPDGDKAKLTIAGEELAWQEGEPVVFDDSYEHAARNDSATQERVLLLFDIWHPHLSRSERESMCSMFDDARQKGWLS